MQPGSDEVTYLERLQAELIRRGLNARLVTKRNQSYLKVANQTMPELNERVFCCPADDQISRFWWPWKQPIGSAEDLDAVASKIVAVLRSVEEQP